jgi:hypothetical protein
MEDETSEKAWREFEILVARIEQILSPMGAVVKSPDKIKDLITGRKRDVDASIRIPDGESSRLITVECRDHKKGRQDDRWIEQLVTKRQKIGADKTIAVSSSGFSASAIKTAQHFGIELRQMSQITDAEIAQEWVGGFRIVVVRPEYALVDARIVYADGTPALLSHLPDEIAAAFQKDGTSTGFIRIKGVAELVSAAHLFEVRVPHSEWLTRDGEFYLTVALESKADTFKLATKDGERVISRLALTYVVQKTETASNVQSVRRYSSMEEPLMDQVNSAADLGDGTLHTAFFGRLFKPFPDQKDSNESAD